MGDLDRPCDRFVAHDDACLATFRRAWQDVGFDFPPDARVLELGSAEADWIGAITAVRPDLRVTGVDWRAADRPQAAALIQGDLLTIPLTGPFDAVIAISTLEHIGLHHYEAVGGEPDPLDPDGDWRAMRRIATEWLVPGGFVYADVPFNPAGFAVCGTRHRIYDAPTLRARLLAPPLMVQWLGRLDPLGPLPTDPLPAGEEFCYAGFWARRPC